MYFSKKAEDANGTQSEKIKQKQALELKHSISNYRNYFFLNDNIYLEMLLLTL